VAGVDRAWAQGSGNGTASPESKGSNRDEEIGDFDRLVKQANRLVEQKKISEAIARWEDIVRLSEKIYGSNHIQTATSLNNLAFLYSSEGLYGNAEPLYVHALAIRLKALDSVHSQTTNLNDLVELLNNLASLYIVQGLYGKAEPVCIDAVAFARKALGPEHPKTLASLNNLATLYYSQGLYGKAEPLYVQAIAIAEKTLGLDHPDTAISLNSLATLYSKQGFYSKAEPLFNQALGI
jgi:tetratricopeptide (TPR) repeat protein